MAEVLINNLTFSDPLDKAIEGPRVYYDFQTGQVAVEGEFKCVIPASCFTETFPNLNRI